MVASLLNLPMSCFISKMEREGDSWKIEREIDGGMQSLKIPQKAVLSCDLRLNVPKLPTLPGILKAKR